MVSSPQVFPPDPTCTFSPIVAICPYYWFLLNLSTQVASCGREGGGMQIVKSLVISSLSSSVGACAFTTAVSHPRPHSSTMYVTALQSQLLMCSPCVHKTLLLIDAYEQYNRLLLHCPPPPSLQPTCCISIKSDLKFANSLAQIFSASDLQSASTRRPFNASYVVPTG